MWRRRAKLVSNEWGKKKGTEPRKGSEKKNHGAQSGGGQARGGRADRGVDGDGGAASLIAFESSGRTSCHGSWVDAEGRATTMRMPEASRRSARRGLARTWNENLSFGSGKWCFFERQGARLTVRTYEARPGLRESPKVSDAPSAKVKSLTKENWLSSGSSMVIDV